MKQNHERKRVLRLLPYTYFFAPVLRNLLKSKYNTIYNMKNIDPEKSNSNQPPQIYICLVVSLSPQWLLICSKKKKIKWSTTHTCSSSTISLQTPNPAMADHSKPQTQPWPTAHSSSPPLQHHLRWWFSSFQAPSRQTPATTISPLLYPIFPNLTLKLTLRSTTVVWRPCIIKSRLDVGNR